MRKCRRSAQRHITSCFEQEESKDPATGGNAHQRDVVEGSTAEAQGPARRSDGCRCHREYLLR
jgi:hypothetical protein